MSEHSVATLGSSSMERGAAGPRVALVGTYPPTRCGIASFGASLRAALLEAGASRVDVVRVLETGEGPDDAPGVALSFRPDDPAAVRRAGTFLSTYDAVVIQHEFGIYGPASGAAVVELVDSCQVPPIVTLHTVTEDLTAQQRQVLEALTARSAIVVVLSETARRILVSRYGVDPSRVEVIPHGTETVLPDGQEVPLDLAGTGPLLLTWGLIGPGKGLDWAVAAIPAVREAVPGVRWVIAGQTHPKVVAHEGERYRRGLERAIADLAVQEEVLLVDAYLSRGQIHRLIRQASAVVLPYDSTQQTSSGVLMEAVAAGAPVVATAFPQAVEVAERGGAVVVPHRDARALAGALIRLVTDRGAAARMVAAQRSMAARADWREVGVAYLDLVGASAGAIAS